MAGIMIDGTVGIKFVAPMSVHSNQPAFVSDTLNLKQQVARQKVQRWEVTTNLEPSNNSADFLIHSVVNGFDTVFEIQMPQVYRGLSKITTATRAETDDNCPAGAELIPIDMSGLLAAGEFIQFANHPKVYMVKKNATQAGPMQIHPQLVKSVPGGTKILIGNDVRMQCRYDPTTALGITYTDGILSDPGTVKLIEAL